MTQSLAFLRGRSAWGLRAALVFACAAGWAADRAWCQQDRTAPRENYFAAFLPFFEGDYRTAGRAFQDAAASGVRNVDGRWIDSICHHAMIGECHYQMGEIGPALEQYEAALKLYLAHQDWMLKVQFPPGVSASASTIRSGITWGTSKRGTALAAIPSRLPIMQGRLDNEEVLRRGGVVQLPEFRAVHVAEVARCTVLALRRRLELLGPNAQFDPLSHNLVTALSARPAPPNHWSQSWISAQLGLALASAGNGPLAVAELEKSLLVDRFDHPLTAAALVELGKFHFAQGKFELAAGYFLEASYAAAAFEQYDLVEEALRGGAMNQMASGVGGLYAPLATAPNWVGARRSTALQASLAIASAENCLLVGQTAQAGVFLTQAQRLIGNREMGAGEIGCRRQYQFAHWNFQQGNLANGQAALRLALAYQQTASRWLLHIRMADKLYTARVITPRQADELYAYVLRDPTPADWAVNPLECLTALVTAPAAPFENWFEALIAHRKEPERALEIADRVRQRRFFGSVALGGRLLALRWLLEAPADLLPESARLRRQDLLTRYPQYALASKQALAARDALAAKPLFPADDAERKPQAALFTEWARLSAAQEVMLHDLALRREPADLLFPPTRSLADIKAAMPADQLTLAFFATSRAYYAFLLTKDKYGVRQITEVDKFRKELVALLRALGNLDKNHVVAPAALADNEWRKSAEQLLNLILENPKDDFFAPYKELVVVPDGLTWYVPFEALPAAGAKSPALLIERLRVRTTPFVSLSAAGAPLRPAGAPRVVLGKLAPREGDDIAPEAFAKLRRAAPGAEAWPKEAPAPSSLAAALTRGLVVWDDIDETASGAYDWAPLQVDRGKPGSTLANWFALPWGGAEHVVLPGFHTPAETSLKGGGAGDELFLNSTAFLANGARTVLLSRWRVGGASAFDLTREFTQELGHTRAADAWRRAVLLTRRNELDLENEPRVRGGFQPAAVTAEHPFFWAGYVLVDLGDAPAAAAGAE